MVHDRHHRPHGWLRFLEANVLSGIRLSRHYVQGMRGRNWGRIVFVLSESAVQIPTEMIHYGMTTTAQLSVARGLAETLAGTNVTVSSVLPGPTASEGVGTFVAQLGAERGLDAAAMDASFSVRPGRRRSSSASPPRPRLRRSSPTCAAHRPPAPPGPRSASMAGWCARSCSHLAPRAAARSLSLLSSMGERCRTLSSQSHWSPSPRALRRSRRCGRSTSTSRRRGRLIAEAMLDLAGTRADDVVYDLGSGDGRLVILAAQRHGRRASATNFSRRWWRCRGSRPSTPASPNECASSRTICARPT